MADKFRLWPELVEEVRAQHNGVMSIELYLDSGVSMQIAVERCIAEWLLELKAQNFAKNPELEEGAAQ